MLMSRSWMVRSTSNSVRSAISQTLAEMLNATGLTMLPSSVFFLRMVPVTGALRALLSGPPPLNALPAQEPA